MNRWIAGMVLLFYFNVAPVLSGSLLSAQEGEAAVLSGKIADSEGLPVEGARVYLYDSAEVRRSANHISAPTGVDGLYRMNASPGRYWSIARLKKTEGYGALMTGDRHSGDPAEIEIFPGKEITRDFVVTDLREAMKLKARERGRLIRISGKIIDEKGSPVPGAYAIAHRSRTLAGIPDHLSAYVDKEGRYMLFLPEGNYYIGSATSFPPGNDSVMNAQALIDADRTDMDIVRTSR